ncbi:MAG TPA: rubredoxin [Planctomycetota bacterium]|nr:rubredoxin [Planctomycetota bacterium]OQC21602.1 MAG: hypothetical protein BWX69_00811 [Planctomycetes bacterium ADurb.Bin069]HNR98532.1 rubredoxin [Planctomycetota bacterium]HNU26226.1 rubredoxin [Planctomycetota bacterium]HOE28756.1 rubredoxin [Planctomycetota bacterium]
MKRWRCRVCGYECEAEEPPERCPVCGADRSFFTAEDDAPSAAPGPAAPEPAVPEPAASSAPAAPEPAASAAPSAPAGPAAGSGKAGKLMAFAAKWLVRLHAHPISAHVPNGVLPVAVVFLLLGLVFAWSGMRDAAFYNVVFVVCALPLVLCSGYLDWKVKLKKARAPIIVGKIVCGAVSLVIGVGVIVWRIFGGEAALDWPFFCALLVMLGAAGTAGYLGGKLVFGRHEGLD